MTVSEVDVLVYGVWARRSSRSNGQVDKQPIICDVLYNQKGALNECESCLLGLRYFGFEVVEAIVNQDVENPGGARQRQGGRRISAGKVR